MTTIASDLLPARTTAVLAAIGFGAIALFQVALALGAPLGRAAWGGGHAGTLPTGLRIASAVAIAIWAFAMVLVLGALMNFASPSAWERFLWGPVGLVMSGLTLVLARTDVTP